MLGILVRRIIDIENPVLLMSVVGHPTFDFYNKAKLNYYHEL